MKHGGYLLVDEVGVVEPLAVVHLVHLVVEGPELEISCCTVHLRRLGLELLGNSLLPSQMISEVTHLNLFYLL